jgi:hypothetical protein
MGSYSPPPLKLEVEKSSWSEIGRIYIPDEHADHSPPRHITWDEKRHIAVYSTRFFTLTLNFANFTYTAQQHWHHMFANDFSGHYFSILRRYEARLDASTNEYIVRYVDQYITPPYPAGLPGGTWYREILNVSPSGRYLVWEFWRGEFVEGEPRMVFVFYR